MTLPKSWTGLEEKADGTLIYNERGALSLLKENKRSYIISKKTRDTLKKITIAEVFVAISLLVYLKLQNFTLVTVVFCFILFLALDSIAGILKNKFVSKNSKEYIKKSN